MKVKDLIEELSKLDPEALIVTPESTNYNYFSEYASASPGWFRRGEGECEFYGDDDEEFKPKPGDVKAVAVQ